jgi:hypothetical protein
MASAIHVGHRPSDGDRAKLLPDAAVKRRPAHVEREMKSLGGLVHEADHLRQVIVDDGRVGDERGLGKTGGEVGAQLAVVGADQNGADAVGTTGDQHPAQGAFADRIGENVNGNIGMRCSDCCGCMLQGSFGNHEVHRFGSFDPSS